MLNYAQGLNSEQVRNASIIIAECLKQGITNPYTIAAILAVISKESNFKPIRENMNYSNANTIARVFGMPLSEAEKYVNKPESLGNRVYGGKYGTPANEGYKYRGGGYNQITFKANYDKYGVTPENITNPEYASRAAITFFKNAISALKSSGKLAEYGANDINGFKDLRSAALAIFHANAGIGRKVSDIKSNSDRTGGKTKTLNRVESLYLAVKDNVFSLTGEKKN